MDFRLTTPDLASERIGNTGTAGVWQFDSAEPGRTLMLSALLHGNELCGAWALKDLLASGFRPRRGGLVLAFCNLDAFDRFDHSRHDASRFVEEDMNRVWSTDRLDRPSSADSRRAAALRPWVERADWLLDLHSMHEPSAPLLLTGVLPRNVALARELKAPAHVIVDAGHKDGVRMRDFAQFGDAARTDACALLIECGFHGDLSSRAVACDMVARMLLASGIADPEDIPRTWLSPDPPTQRVLRVTDAIVAPSIDFRFARPWQCLDTLPNRDTVLGWADGETIATPYDQCTLIMPSLRQLKPGVTVMRLAQDI